MEFLACEKLAQVNVGVNCVRAALEGHRRAGTAAHGAGAVYAGVFSTPQTEAGIRWIPLSDPALTLCTNRGRRAGNRSASRKGWCALHDFSLILRAWSRDQREGVLVESPRGNATTLSGSPSSAASWWVAITIEGRPARSACSRMRRHVSIPSASNPPSGSSITNNRGSAARARAMATRWRSPVESRRTSLFRSCSRLSVVKSSRAR